VIPDARDERRLLLARAVESLADAIMLLEWRYEVDAVTSIAKLEHLLQELQLAQAMLDSGDRLH
jgi:hypothetical protein